MEPPAEVMGSFKLRGDNQIMSLEILSIALGARGLHACSAFTIAGFELLHVRIVEFRG
jgi:hypothetical protein